MHAALFGLAATAIYLLMILITLAHIEALSGLRPFDMRPGGYSPDQAKSLLNALGAIGRNFYLTRQLPLDLAYPALMAWTLVSLLRWFESRGAGQRFVQIGIWLSIGAAISDYLENAGICLMILSWPNLSDSIVRASSFASIVKSGLTSAAVLTVLLSFVIWSFGRIRTYAQKTKP